MAWFKRPVKEVLKELDSGWEGLSEGEAGARLKALGPNTIQRGKDVSPWKVLLHQFTSPLIYVLLGALLLTLSIQSFADAIVIGAVLVINATVGFIQEYRAESAVQSLMQMMTPKAVVIRDGRTQEVDSKDLVPGDVVELSQGQMVPGDGRLMQVESLQVNESALTGESVPVNKSTEPLRDADEELPAADQKN
ncbi:MAG: HAD-IC family P-type ATPase, partial [Candidatus Eisenbacteria bacterium]|nr:HAD-IC family P-type ATPase [Candidatus Eisenbacteria bacterium]